MLGGAGKVSGGGSLAKLAGDGADASQGRVGCSSTGDTKEKLSPWFYINSDIQTVSLAVDLYPFHAGVRTERKRHSNHTNEAP